VHDKEKPKINFIQIQKTTAMILATRHCLSYIRSKQKPITLLRQQN